jgi:hypothetical protein
MSASTPAPWRSHQNHWSWINDETNRQQPNGSSGREPWHPSSGKKRQMKSNEHLHRMLKDWIICKQNIPQPNLHKLFKSWSSLCDETVMAHGNVFIAKETLLQRHEIPQPTYTAPFISLIVHSLIQNAHRESQRFCSLWQFLDMLSASFPQLPIFRLEFGVSYTLRLFFGGGVVFQGGEGWCLSGYQVSFC